MYTSIYNFIDMHNLFNTESTSKWLELIYVTAWTQYHTNIWLYLFIQFQLPYHVSTKSTVLNKRKALQIMYENPAVLGPRKKKSWFLLHIWDAIQWKVHCSHYESDLCEFARARGWWISSQTIPLSSVCSTFRVHVLL